MCLASDAIRQCAVHGASCTGHTRCTNILHSLELDYFCVNNTSKLSPRWCFTPNYSLKRIKIENLNLDLA